MIYVYYAAAHIPNPLRAYVSDLRSFAAWSRALEVASLPAEPRTVALYLADAGRRPSTIGRALTAINIAHARAGMASPREAPEVRDAWRGVRRVLSVASRPKAPVDRHVLPSEDRPQLRPAAPWDELRIGNETSLLRVIVPVRCTASFTGRR